jgi:glycosyltransferase involved in cell wall biosynthesis
MNNTIFFCPSIEEGGVEKNLFLISNFISSFNKIFLITINTSKKKYFNNQIDFVSPKLNIFAKYPRILKSLMAAAILIKIILKLRNEKKTVISFQSNIIAIIICKLFKIKIIIRSNTFQEKYLNNNLIKKKIFGFFFKLADAIIVNSIEFKKRFNKTFNVKSICIYNPIVKEKIKIKIKNNSILKIISVGRLTEQKDHLTLLKAFKILLTIKRAKLYIVGKGHLLSSLKNFVLNNGLKKNVFFLGYKNSILNYLNSSDLIILSSKYEGLPNCLVEAQMQKINIISSDCFTGPKEILMNVKAGFLFPVGNFNELSKILINFNKKGKKEINMRNIGYKNLYRFDYNTNCTKYLNLINKFTHI